VNAASLTRHRIAITSSLIICAKSGRGASWNRTIAITSVAPRASKQQPCAQSRPRRASVACNLPTAMPQRRASAPTLPRWRSRFNLSAPALRWTLCAEGLASPPSGGLSMRFIVLGGAFFVAACSNSSDGNLGNHISASNTALTVEEQGKSASGPFGIAMGGPISQVDGWKKLERAGLYSTSSPPNSHPDFEQVVVEAYPSTGVCMIRGIGKNNEGDGSGSAVKIQIGNLADALATKYGPYESVDLCSAGDIACQGEFWMMNLGNGGVLWGKKWEKKNQNMATAGIGSIFVTAAAQDINTSYAVLEFSSSDEKGCKAGSAASSAKSL
jgi:hypothetical protein